jgi:NAD(P)-dependent dehydrogenase (short-subunit alcohol dehydrogenase family)
MQVEKRVTTVYIQNLLACVSEIAGPFLLTNLLMDALVAPGDKSRVINVASGAHRRGAMQFDDLMLEKKFSGYTAYAQSKLSNILFSRELSRRLG